MTREVLNKLSDTVSRTVENLKIAFKNCEDYQSRTIARARAFAYTQGLADGGYITDRERQCLYIYITL